MRQIMIFFFLKKKLTFLEICKFVKKKNSRPEKTTVENNSGAIDIARVVEKHDEFSPR